MDNARTFFSHNFTPWFFLLFACSISGCVYLGIHLRRERLISSKLDAKLELSNKEISQFVLTMNENHRITTGFVGKKIKYTESLELLNPNGNTYEFPPSEPSLLLIFSELSCNVCRDEETAFGNSVWEELGEQRVFSIVQSKTKRYSVNYIRMNQAKFPVYYDRDGLFLFENEISNTPLLCLVNPDGSLQLVHFPIPGHEEICTPFHEAIRNALQVE